MSALRAKTQVGWVLVRAPSLSEFLFFQYLYEVQNLAEHGCATKIKYYNHLIL